MISKYIDSLLNFFLNSLLPGFGILSALKCFSLKPEFMCVLLPGFLQFYVSNFGSFPGFSSLSNIQFYQTKAVYLTWQLGKNKHWQNKIEWEHERSISELNEHSEIPSIHLRKGVFFWFFFSPSHAIVLRNDFAFFFHWIKNR